MVLVERISYQVGRVVGDVIYFTAAPTIIVIGGKCAGKIQNLASKVALADKSPAAITENVFKCLPFIE